MPRRLAIGTSGSRWASRSSSTHLRLEPRDFRLQPRDLREQRGGIAALLLYTMHLQSPLTAKQ